MTLVDHLVVAVPDLDAAIDDVAVCTGVRPEFGGAHEGLGTHNALVSFGTGYLELIAPDPGQPDPSGRRPFGVDDIDTPTLVTFAVRPATGVTIEQVVAAAIAAGHDPGPIVGMHRLRPDGERLEWRLTLPTGAGDGLVPFIIDWGTTVPPSVTAPGGMTLTSFELHVPVSDADTRSWIAALAPDVTVVDREPTTLAARLDGPAGPISFGAPATSRIPPDPRDGAGR